MNRILLALTVIVCFATPADACQRCGLLGNRCVIKQVQAVHQKVYAPAYAAAVVYPQVSYFVGQPIRVESLVVKALREDPEYAAFQQFRQWQQLQAAQPAPQAQPLAAAARLPLLSAKCIQCHSGDKPKGGLLLDGTSPIDAGYFATAARLMKLGKMPKGKPPLGDAERLQIQDELQSLIEQPAEPVEPATDPVPPAPEPPTEKTP